MCWSVEKCLCRVSLEVGAQIISILNLLVPLVEIGYCLYMAITLQLSEIKVTSVYVVLIVLSVFELFCAAVFIHGAFKKQPSFMWPWLILAWLKAAVVLVLFVVWVTLVSVRGYHGYEQIVFIVVLFAYAVIVLYSGLVSNSRRLELQSEKYAASGPRRTRSNSAIVRNVYVPIIKQLEQP